MKKKYLKNRFRSIRRQLTFALGVVVGGIMILFLAIAIVYNSRSLEKDLHHRLNGLLQLAASGLSTALWQYNYEYVNDYVDALFSSQDLVFARVTADGKAVKQRFGNPETAREESKRHDAGMLLTKTAPIRYNDVLVGRLTLSASRERIEARILIDSIVAVSLLLLIIGSIFLTLFFLSRKILFQPLARLENFARDLSNGRLDATIDIDTENEIGRLARTFNQMAAKLKTTLASRDELEKEVAEKERLQSELVQARKMEAIGTLAGGIAHDFNNILSSIIGFTELALEEVENDASLKNHLEEVLAAGTRARDLVRQILTFARRDEKTPTPVRVGKTAEEALQFLRSTLPASIEIRGNLSGEALVIANPAQIHQLFLNLCMNAAQAMERSGGVLSIDLKDIQNEPGSPGQRPDLSPGRYVQITVSDTGPGIGEEHLGSIFDPYFTTKGLGKGTGLGLAVVHGIVESVGGSISVESTAGRGACFTVLLPAFEGRFEPPPLSTPETALAGGAERILLVDDEKPIVRMASRILKGLGYEVAAFSESLDALEHFRSDPNGFDLVLTDMTMPHMNGDRLAEEMLKIRPDAAIVICSGHSSRMTAEKAERIGIAAFAMKPMDKEKLARTVREVLDRRLAPLRTVVHRPTAAGSEVK